MIKSICFSGHRFNKIKSMISEKTSNLENQINFFETIKSIIYIKINHYIDEGFKTFYIGMSNGIDLWVGEILLELKLTQYPDINIISVIPFHNHGINFSHEDKILYNQILDNSENVIQIQYEKSKGAYLERNRYMVDNTTNLLAFICDYESGTGYTIKYAKELNKSIEIINLQSLSVGFMKSVNENKPFYDMINYI